MEQYSSSKALEADETNSETRVRWTPAVALTILLLSLKFIPDKELDWTPRAGAKTQKLLDMPPTAYSQDIKIRKMLRCDYHTLQAGPVDGGAHTKNH